MKTALKVLRIVAGIFFALAATSGITRIAIVGSVFSYYGAGVCAAAIVSWACLRPMKIVLRITTIVIGIWFALWAVGGVVVVLVTADKGSLATAGPLHDGIFLAVLACIFLQDGGRALAHKLRARMSRDRLNQTSTS